MFSSLFELQLLPDLLPDHYCHTTLSESGLDSLFEWRLFSQLSFMHLRYLAQIYLQKLKI